MMKLKSVLSIILFATVMISPIIANGDWQSPVWTVHIPAGMDEIELFIVNDIGSENPDFVAPGADNFSLPGWSGTVINPNYTLATGPATTDLSYNWLFTGTAANQAFDVDSLIYLNNIIEWSVRARWDGSNWDLMAAVPPPAEYDRTPAVPEPSTILLLGAGLAGVGILRRRFKG